MRGREFIQRIPWPAIADLFCLFLLAAAMIFSVWNIGAHRLAERLWKPIDHGLSPDGKEYVSISLAGLRVHDAETGRERDRMTWRGPWNFPDWPMSDFAAESAYLYADRDRSAEYQELHLQETEAKVTTHVSLSKRFVVGSFPGGAAVWWDRVAGSTKVVNFPEHLLLRCFIDEANDRYWLEGIRFPATKIARRTAERVQELKTESLLGRRTEVWEMRLRDSERVALHTDLYLGSPIADDFKTRLVADAEGENPRVLRWRQFLKEEPTEIPYADHWFLGKLDDCQIYLQGEVVVIDQLNSRLLLHPRPQRELGDLLLRPMPRDVNLDNELSTSGAQLVYCDERALGIQQTDHPNKYRFQFIDYPDRIRDLRCRDAHSREILRAADEKGRIWDTPTTKQGVARHGPLALAPYPWFYLQSLAVFTLAAALWIFSAVANRSLVKPHGGFILFCCSAWPLFCWGAEQSCDATAIAFGVRVIMLTAGALFCSLGALLLVSYEKPLRPAVLCLAIGISTYYLWSLGSHCFGGSYF